MNVNYTKAVLYTYPHIDTRIIELDACVKELAIKSFRDCSSCEKQCERITMLQLEKSVLADLKRTMDIILRHLTKHELDILDYKYFKQKPKSYHADFNYTNRYYFREQHKLVKKISSRLALLGYHDEWFETVGAHCTSITNCLVKAIEHDEAHNKKNKSKKRK